MEVADSDHKLNLHYGRKQLLPNVIHVISFSAADIL